jgi:replicative DNA helicase
VFDMIDNIKFGGAAANNGQRTDQLLEAMYQWARVLGVKHDCVVLANSQISSDGENMQYPLLSMLKDSKTGKQGAADFILTIGYQSTNPDTRYLGTTKNKLAVEGGPKQLKHSVIFDGARGRYVEPKVVDEPPAQANDDPLETR